MSGIYQSRLVVAAFITICIGVALLMGIRVDAATTCGPYTDITVTGVASGVVWGSGPYGALSNFNAAAVHAGLIDVGETATIRRTSVGSMSSFSASVQNGVSSLFYTQSMCAVTLSIADGTGSTSSSGSSGSTSGSGSTSSSSTSSSGSSSTGTGSTSGSSVSCGSSYILNIDTESSANNTGEAVYGTGTYREGSRIRDAILHAGILKKGEWGQVKVIPTSGEVSGFVGSTQNGIRSLSYTGFDCGFKLELVSNDSCGPYTVQTVTGTTTGKVYGGGSMFSYPHVYADDSKVGAAAVHAGVLRNGQTASIKLIPVKLSLQGLDISDVDTGYKRNGVTPLDVSRSGSQCVVRLERMTQPTTTTENACGPYADMIVKGATDGSVWFNGNYSDASNMGKASIHSGFLKTGEMAKIKLTYKGVVGGTSIQNSIPNPFNGITTLPVEGSSSRCLVWIEPVYESGPLMPITESVSLGSENKIVKRLQAFLTREGYLTSGNITGYFGETTRTAVKKYQCEKKITCSGDGYGSAGPLTRSAMNARIAEYNAQFTANNYYVKSTSSTGSTDGTSSTGTTAATIEELLKIIEDLKKQIELLSGTSGTIGTVCTADVQMCSDGSYVSRVAPACTFAACPSVSTSGSGSGTSASFAIGSKVTVTGKVNVRSTPSLSATILGTADVGKTGTIIGGPTVADGYTWWKIDYASGADGWSVSSYLSSGSGGSTGTSGSTGTTGTSGSTGTTGSTAITGQVTAISAPGEVYYSTPFTITVTMKNPSTKAGNVKAQVSLTTDPTRDAEIDDNGTIEAYLEPGKSTTVNLGVQVNADAGATKGSKWNAQITSLYGSTWTKESLVVLPVPYSIFLANCWVTLGTCPESVQPGADLQGTDSDRKQVYSSTQGKWVYCDEYPNDSACTCVGTSGTSYSYNPNDTGADTCKVYVGGLTFPYGMSYLPNITSGYTGNAAIECTDAGTLSLDLTKSTCTAE